MKARHELPFCPPLLSPVPPSPPPPTLTSYPAFQALCEASVDKTNELLTPWSFQTVGKSDRERGRGRTPEWPLT